MTHTSPLKVNLSVAEILKRVYANSAWRAMDLNNKIDYPEVITSDRKPILNIMVKDALTHCIARLASFITGYNITMIDNDFISIDMIVPRGLTTAKCRIVADSFEQAVALIVLGKCYDTSHYSPTISEEYAQDAAEKIRYLKVMLNTSCTPSTAGWL